MECRIFALFYICINLGSLSPLITTQVEQHLGFSSAFAVAMVVFFIGFSILSVSRSRLVNKAPEGSVFLSGIKITYIAFRNRGSFAAAKPSHSSGSRDSHTREWDDAFVDSLADAFSACQLFLVYPLF